MVATLRTPAARLIAALGLSLSLIVPPLVLRPSAAETSVSALPSVVSHTVGSVGARAVPHRLVATKRLSAPAPPRAVAAASPPAPAPVTRHVAAPVVQMAAAPKPAAPISQA